MGCGATKVEVEENESNSDVNADKSKDGNLSNGHIKSEKTESGGVENETPVIELNKAKNDQNQIQSHNQINDEKNNELYPKAVAFDVGFNNIDNILKKNPPRKLSKLEPLKNAPKLTSDMLTEKQKQAEEKREKELNKKREISRKSSSRLRKQLQEAKELDKAQETTQEIEEKQRSAGKLREAKRLEMIEKQRLRQERARQARERAKRMQEAEQEGLDIDVEKDETYNNEDDVDSWLEGENNNAIESDAAERIYSGRESPKKRYNPRSSAEMKARASAFSTSTTDSFDYAFQREPVRVNEATNKRDDFFDT